MPRTRYRHGRKDHNRRVAAYRLEARQNLIAAGKAMIAAQLQDIAEADQPKNQLIPYVSGDGVMS